MTQYCYCGKDKISLADLRRYIENQEEFIKLDNGRLVRITNREELERFMLDWMKNHEQIDDIVFIGRKFQISFNFNLLRKSNLSRFF